MTVSEELLCAQQIHVERKPDINWKNKTNENGYSIRKFKGQAN